MGIPLYFKKVTSEFKNIISREKVPNVSRLFLDFNCAIHHCSNQLKASKVEYHTDEEFEDDLISKCIQYIEILQQHVKPSSLIYVSIDGVVPMAKIAQQRKRRYMSHWMRSHPSATNDGRFVWNSNAITPGTVFMHKLVSALQGFSESYHGMEIIIDNNEGEGEHKICHYIRKHPIDGVDVIYGLDADLILLTMLSSNYANTYLLRENFKNSSIFEYMNIKHTKYQIHEQLLQALGIQKADMNHLFKCYTFLTFFLGNDFLPNLTYINLRWNGIEHLLKAYRKTFDFFDRSEHILNAVNAVNAIDTISEINMPFLSHFLEIMAHDEDDEFQKQEDAYYMARTSTTSDIEQYPLKHKYPKCINSQHPGWRSNYYYYLFQKNTNSTIVSNACNEYIQGLVWTTNYYFNQHTEWYWFYKHNYSPTIVDLSNYITGKPSLSTEMPKTKWTKIHANDQLVMVLPPSNMHLIPSRAHQNLVQDIHAGYVHNFPTSFEICTYMKYKLHECGCVGLSLNEPILLLLE